jgi:hypothetical protein
MNISLKELLAGGVPYFVCVGAAYTLGYWGAFDINVLEFIGLSELGKMAVYPLLATLALGVLGMVGTQLLSARILPPGGGADTVIGRAGRRYWRVLVALVIAGIYVAVLYAQEPGKWYVVALLAGTLSIPLGYVPKIIELLPNPHLRSFLLLLFITLPTFSFAQGRLMAHFVKHGHAEMSVDAQRSALPGLADPANTIIYVGYIGGTYVLRESRTGALLLVKPKDEAPLYLLPGRGRANPSPQPTVAGKPAPAAELKR